MPIFNTIIKTLWWPIFISKFALTQILDLCNDAFSAYFRFSHISENLSDCMENCNNLLPKMFQFLSAKIYDDLFCKICNFALFPKSQKIIHFPSVSKKLHFLLLLTIFLCFRSIRVFVEVWLFAPVRYLTMRYINGKNNNRRQNRKNVFNILT